MSYDGGERERHVGRTACRVASHKLQHSKFPHRKARGARTSLALLPQEDGQNDCVKDWEANNATYGSRIRVDLDNHRSSFASHVNMLPTR